MKNPPYQFYLIRRIIFCILHSELAGVEFSVETVLREQLFVRAVDHAVSEFEVEIGALSSVVLPAPDRIVQSDPDSVLATGVNEFTDKIPFRGGAYGIERIVPAVPQGEPVVMAGREDRIFRPHSNCQTHPLLGRELLRWAEFICVRVRGDIRPP